MKRVCILAFLVCVTIGTLFIFSSSARAEDSATAGTVSPTTISVSTTSTGSGSGTSNTPGTAPSTSQTSAGTSATTDTSPPVISNVAVDSVTYSAARIRWNTDDPSDSRAIYGITLGNYPYTSTSHCDGTGLTTSHCMYFTNLAPSTLYYFVVTSKNAAGLAAYITGHSFKTTANTSDTSGGTSGSAVVSTSAGTPTTQTAPAAQPPTPLPSPTPTSSSLSPSLTLISQPATVTTGISTAPIPVPANTSGVRLLEEPKALVPQPVAPSVIVISPVSSTAIVPPSALETPRTQLENVGTSVRTFQSAVNTVNTSVQSAVSQDVEKAVNDAVQSQPTMATDDNHPFDPAERAAQLEDLKQAINEKQQQLSEDVQTTLTSGAPGDNPLPNIEPVLKSSLDDIALIIKDQTGVTVDLSPTARTVANDVQEQSAQFDSARQALQARDGLDLYTDSDGDGISDYDEVHIYHTDPHNAYSSGGSLTDGEKILLGFDVSTSTIRRVPVESPMASGEETKNVFEVDTISVSNSSTQPPTGTSTVAAPLPLQATSSAGPVPVPPIPQQKVTFAGRALPNSFITLYIYSTPIVVTVKTDISGAWKYTLDSELPDGNHNLYVATVDAGGKILAKSPAIPFVKTAEAAEFTPLVISESPSTDPLNILRNNMLIIALAGLAIFAALALGILGFRHTEPKSSDVASA